MTDRLLPHPTHDQLTAFAAGRLDDRDSTIVEQHLEDCADCCHWLRRTPGDDSYVQLLRDAVVEAEAESPTLATASADTAELGPRPSTTVAFVSKSASVPVELTDHPRYRVIRAVGTGGMGAVFEAEHRLMRRRVALKVIKPQWLQSSEAVTRFRREMQAAAKLVHPHVVTAFDAEQAGNLHFLAMEFVEGRTLAQLVAERGPLPVAMAVECIRQAALGLQHAFEHGMVHRDIKPGNMMVAGEWAVGSGQRGEKTEQPLPDLATPHSSLFTVKILDFGLARFASEEAEGSETSVSTLLGTPDFMAPEQARNARDADIRSDLYSLGCTLYFLLTGVVPHRQARTSLERALAHAEQSPQPLSEFRTDIPPALQAILDRLLAKRPEDRFQTPAELVAALAATERPTSSLFEPVMPSHERPLTAGLKRILLAAALFGFVLIMAVVVQVVTDKGDLLIDSEVDGAVVLLRQNGVPVRRIELPRGTSTTRLITGEYTLELQEPSSDLRLSTRRVELSRGKKTEVQVFSVNVPRP
jgi:serine/threonine protein kinase